MFPTVYRWCLASTANCDCAEQDPEHRPGLFAPRCDPHGFLELEPDTRAQIAFCELSCMCYGGPQHNFDWPFSRGPISIVNPLPVPGGNRRFGIGRPIAGA